LELVNLLPVMERGEGQPEVAIGLIDGPVVLDHPELATETIREVAGRLGAACSRASSAACTHGTFVAGVLAAKRGGSAPAICPGCTLLVCPIFSETTTRNGDVPSATPEALADAIVESVNAGARIVNLSAALAQSSLRGEQTLEQALNDAARRGTIVVAAAGNQGTVGSSAITRHPWVIPVAASDPKGRPISESNLGSSIGRRGVSAPGENIISLGTNGNPQISGGTSAAAPFVTGAIALLWSEFPSASATRIKLAVMQAAGLTRRTIFPPLLDAWAAHEALTGQSW